MTTETRLRAPNSLLLVTTADPPDIPRTIDPDGLISNTRTCIAVSTVAEDDGEVAIVLTNEGRDAADLSLACDVTMDCSSGLVAVETVLGERLLAQSVPAGPLEVRVWASNLVEPDRLVIEVVQP